MNILITGGTGLVGKHLISKLLENANITVLTRNLKKAGAQFNKSITLIEQLTLADIEKQDIVINLAGEPIADKRWSNTQKQKICQSRWQLTALISDLINKANNPPRLLISGSAIGIYGRQSGIKIDENFNQYHREFTHHVCAEWERLALAAASKSTRVAILRTGVVLESHGGALAKMLPAFKLGLGGKIGHGQQFMSWIHIEDMVNAILHILATPSLYGAINLTAELPVTNEVFSQALAKTLNRPCLLTIPNILLKGILGEMADILLFGQHVVPTKLKQSGFNFQYPTISKALTHLVN